MAARAAKTAADGQEAGRQGTAAAARGAAAERQKNFTDPESRIIENQGRLHQGYNAQAAVDAAAQVVATRSPRPRREAERSDAGQMADARGLGRGRRTVGGRGLLLRRQASLRGGARSNARSRRGRPSTPGEGEGRRRRRRRRRGDAHRMKSLEAGHSSPSAKKAAPSRCSDRSSRCAGSVNFSCAGSKRSPTSGASSASPRILEANVALAPAY